jgi:hypothetical protein
MKSSEFVVGEMVWYVPRHARGDRRQWERGEVTGVESALVMVKFRDTARGVACDPETLEVKR